MDWNLVQLFVEVLDAGNMSEAARRRGVTRSSVSQRLKLLEQQMKAQLLRRTTRDLQPTEIGLTLYEQGKLVEQQFDAVRHEVESLGRTPSGLVRLSVPPGIGSTHLAPALIAFAKDNPQVNLRVMFNNRVNNLLEAGIDVAFQIVSQPPNDLDARELCEMRWRFFSTPRYLATLPRCEEPSDLTQAAFLATQGGRRLDLEMVAGKQVLTISLTPRFVSENVLFLRECLLKDMGIALLPDYLVRDELASGKIVRVLPRFSSKHLGGKFLVLTMPNRFPTPAAEKVTNFLCEIILNVVQDRPAAGPEAGEADKPVLRALPDPHEGDGSRS